MRNNMKKLFALLSLVLVLCMALSLSACKKKDDTDGSSSDMAYSVNSDSSDDESSVDTESVDASSEETPSSDNSSVGSESSPSSAVQLPTTKDPDGDEILGSGTKNDPYLKLPKISDTFMSATTVSIPAGKSVFYGIQRVVGTILTIENANAYVVFNGTRYDANGGKVSFEVADAKALASDNILFEIGNKGSAPASFKLVFTNKTGSRENPTAVTSLGTDISVNLKADDGAGHYYRYVAAKAGKLRFYLSGTADSTISITNNSTSKNMIGNYTKSKNQLTDPDNADAVVEFIEIDVAAGDEVIIAVGTLPNKRGNYPANTVTWKCQYA